MLGREYVFNRMVLLGLLVAMALGTADEARAEKKLRWKFTPGQKLALELGQRLETDTSFSNKPVKLVVDVTLRMTWLVDSVEDDGSAQITQSIDSVVMKMSAPPAAIVEFDSTSSKKNTGDAKEIAALVAPFLGAKFMTRFSNRGEVLNVTLPDETTAIFAAADPSSGQSFFSKERIRQMLRLSAAVMPDQEIKSGAKWEEVAQVDSPLGKLKQVTTYTYDGEEDREGVALDKIQLAGQLELPPSTSAGGITLKEQSLSGVVYFNNNLGRVSETQVLQKLKTETKVRENLVAATMVSTLKAVFSVPKSTE